MYLMGKVKKNTLHTRLQVSYEELKGIMLLACT